MHHLTSKLVIYKNINEDSILFRLSNIFQEFEADDYVKEDLISDIYVEINRLLDISTLYGFDKNLWHNYLAFLLSMDLQPNQQDGNLDTQQRGCGRSLPIPHSEGIRNWKLHHSTNDNLRDIQREYRSINAF